MLDRHLNHGVLARSLVFDRRPVALHAMLSAGGIEDRRWPEPYHWEGLRRGPQRFTLIQITLAGEGWLRYEDTEHRVPVGSAMVLSFPHDHAYGVPPRGRWRFFYLCLHGDQVMRLWREALAASGPVLPMRASDPLYHTVAAACEDVVEDRVASPFDASAKAYAVTMALMDHVASRIDAAARPVSREIDRAVALAKRRFADPIGVDDLAAAAGMSRYHFTRRFREATGMPPGEFLIRQRLSHAVGLLQTSALPIEQVAERCGFADANHLGKRFRKAYGVSPGALRRGGMFGPPPSAPAD